MTLTFSADYLQQQLAALGVAPDAPLVVAVSGGADSLSLAHAVANTRRPARLVHVNHQLHPQSAQWAEQVRTQAKSWGLSCRIVSVELLGTENLEARARDSRYRALAAQLNSGETVLTAHHQDDQALTLFLQLLRGAGPAGLAAMPARADFATGEIVRPLLNLPARALRDYAVEQALQPVNDPSNDDRRFDRNFLRLEMVPMLQDRWPAFAKTLTRSASLCAEADSLQGTLARIDGAYDHALNLDPQKFTDVTRARNALRGFLRARDLTLPPRARLNEFVRQALTASTDSAPSLILGDVRLRVYGHYVFVTDNEAPPPNWSARLENGESLTLPGDAGVLTYHGRNAHIRPLRVTLRRGGERFVQPPERRVKSYLQGLGVLPWRRAWVPLVYRESGPTQLVAIGDWWRSPGLEGQLRWQREAVYRLSDVAGAPEFAQPR
ncbi:MAG: tRNA lysidine(34) synthetase TilS [Gammaproteobacteria bacterium]